MFGNRVRTSNLIPFPPESLDPLNLYHSFFTVHSSDHFLGGREQDLSPFSLNDIDVIGAGGEDLFYLSNPSALFGFNLHSKNLNPIVRAFRQIRKNLFLNEDLFPSKRPCFF